MAGRFLLDTNVLIAVFRQEPVVLERVRLADEILISCISLGELYYGAYKSGRRAENLARVADFAADNAVLLIDSETSQRYGIVKQRLRQKGCPIPENDVWIAALAIQHGLILATRDVHFRHVAELPTETW